MHGQLPLIVHFFVSCLASSPIETAAFAYRVPPSSPNLQLAQVATFGATTAQGAQAVTPDLAKGQLQTMTEVSQQMPQSLQAPALQAVTQPLGSAANVASQAANVASNAAVNANVAATNAANVAASLGKSSIEATTVETVAIAARQAADAANRAAVAASAAASEAAMANAAVGQVSNPVQASSVGVHATQAIIPSPSQQQEIVPIAAATMAPATPVVASNAASQAAIANAAVGQVSTPMQASSDGLRTTQASITSPSQQQEIVPIAVATVAPALPVIASTAASQASVANAMASQVSTPMQAPSDGVAASQASITLPSQQQEVVPIAAATVAPATPVLASNTASQAAIANAAVSQVSTPMQTPSDGVGATQASKTSPSQQQQSVPIVAATMAPATPVVATIRGVPESTYSSSQWFFSQAMQLIYGLTFAMIVKGLCVAGNVLVQVSPISQIKRWEARSCTGEADAAPYVSIAFGGCQWCFYGLFAWIVTGRSGFLILVQSNCLGALLGSYYVVTFYRNCRNDGNMSSLQRYLSAVTSLALLQVCALSVLPAERALFLTGLISSFCSFIGATSVLVTVPQVIRNKDSRSIPGPYALANFLSSLVWTLCGYILADPMVMIPNIFSTCCATASLGLKVLYPSDTNDDETDIKTEEGISGEMHDKQLQMNAKGISKAPTEFTPMLSMKLRKDVHSIPAKFADTAKTLPDHVPSCGGECGTGGTF